MLYPSHSAAIEIVIAIVARTKVIGPGAKRAAVQKKTLIATKNASFMAHP